MASNSLMDLVNALTPEQQAAVRQFIEFLHSKTSQSPNPFLAAVDEFIGEHPEILRRLAQ